MAHHWSGYIGEFFPVIICCFAGRAVLQLAIERIAQAFVKAGGLEVRGGEAGVAATAPTGFTLRLLHQLSSKSLPTNLLIDPDDTDFKPLRDGVRSAYQPAANGSRRIKRGEM